MPIISPENGYLTVINLFWTDRPERQNRLIEEMRAIVNTAAFPGWVSSTVHSGQDKLGTANFIQWRGREDLEARYDGEEFKHRTIPIFVEITTSSRLLQTEVELAQRHPSLGDVTEISPDRDDYTVLEIFDVAPEDQRGMIEAIGESHDWLTDTPGYRSQSVLRGITARGPQGTTGKLMSLGGDNSFVVVYSQWDSKKAYDSFRTLPEADQPVARRTSQAKRDSLTVGTQWNTYRVVHTRSATQPAVGSSV
jgi:heme-degrading monooxygenase HmoA